MDAVLLQPAVDYRQDLASRVNAVCDMVIVHRGADIVLLPELWPTGYFAFDDYARTAEDLDGPTVRALGAAARTAGVHLHAGSMVERDPYGRLYNTSLLFAPDGRLLHTYRKLHLFGSGAKEADLLEPGSSVRAQETEIGRIGMVTCYDLRFPEIFRMLVEDGAELVLLTAAWPADRIAHWRLLVPARALENQVHLLACNAIGYQGQVEVGGESMAVDPWGRVTAAAWRWPGALAVALDPAAVDRARAEIPAFSDRRLTVALEDGGRRVVATRAANPSAETTSEGGPEMLPVPEGIDPQLARLAALQPDLDYGRPQEARAALERALKIAKTMRAAPGPDDGLVVTDRAIPAREGSPDIPVRIYAARRRPEPGPALLFFHGGGFVTGGLETEEARCREIARRTGVLVISVDYRLAPEHPFPRAFEDCYDALLWTAANASALGVDGARIALGGNSAGGALTAAVAMAARDEGGPPPAYQVLLYPVIDHRMTTPSMKRFVDTPGWHQRNNVHMWRHYLGTDTPESVSPYAAPAMAEDLSRLPPAYVMTAEFDPLRDEGVEFARQLLAAGVSVEFHQFPGTFHGFDAAAPEATVTRRALEEQCAVLVRGLGSEAG